MRFCFLFVIGLMVSDAILAQPQEDGVVIRTEYFAYTGFRETPFADPRGVRRITKDQTKGKNHFAFGYDESGKLRQIEYRLGDRPRPMDNNQVEAFFWLTTGIAIDYEKGREIRRFYDHFGDPTTARGAYREIFTIDEFGQRKSLTFENAAGETIENEWGIARYDWRIEQDGTVIENRQNLAGEPVAMRPALPFYEIRLHYRADGWLAKMENFGTDGRLQNNELNAASDVVEFDSEGFLRAWNVFDENGQRVVGNSPQVARGVVTGVPGAFGARVYDLSYYDVDGNPMLGSDEYHRSQTEFDERGNPISIRTYGIEGQLISVPARANVAMGVFEWSEDGFYRTAQAFFDEKEQPFELPAIGAHRIEQDYDEQGRMIESRLVTVDGSLSRTSPRGFAVVRVKYDEDGARTDTFYDADGNEVQPSQAGR